MSPRDSDNGLEKKKTLKRHSSTPTPPPITHNSWTENTKCAWKSCNVYLSSLITCGISRNSNYTVHIKQKNGFGMVFFNNSSTTNPNCFILSYLIYIYSAILYQKRFISQLDILLHCNFIGMFYKCVFNRLKSEELFVSNLPWISPK